MPAVSTGPILIVPPEPLELELELEGVEMEGVELEGVPPSACWAQT